MRNNAPWLLSPEQQITPLCRWQRALDLITRLFHTPTGLIVQHYAQQNQVVSAASHPSCPYRAGVSIAAATKQFSCRVLASPQSLYYPNKAQQPDWLQQHCRDTPLFTSWLGTALYWPDGQPFGTLCLLDHTPTLYNDTLLALLAYQRDSLQNDLLLLQQYDQTRQLACRDHQTGLTNLQGFLVLAEHRAQLALQNHETLGLLYIELDGIKPAANLADSLQPTLSPQQQVDSVLKVVAKALRQHIRERDLVARVTADGFVILISLRQPDSLTCIGQRILSTPLPHHYQLRYHSMVVQQLRTEPRLWLAQLQQQAKTSTPSTVIDL
ncbi:MAG: GGDEF domain-containing protein [Marinobacterium sp.]|nr:GGDEF domain-containing protein [Marinobacterium sp.]